uniref:Protein PTHB1 n=1 Tax=Sphaerodactylus townsendi TaxID=933632 RepID=A0ACB8FU91_9SAUR
MSLFKARDWWSTVVGNKEEFDQGCLCVANIDNSSGGQDKIIVGSYMGFLRIYHPHPAKPGDPMQVEELLLETQLREPILQVEVGKFVSGTELLHLAVLHCKKLCVYAVSGILGNTEHGNQYQLKLMYEHNLQRTACNMTYGPFGGIKEKLPKSACSPPGYAKY